MVAQPAFNIMGVYVTSTALMPEKNAELSDC